MDGLQRLLAFADYLRSQRMPFLFGQTSEDAITLSFGTFGNRFSLDFYEDHVLCHRFRGTEQLRADLSEVHAIIDARVPDFRSIPISAMTGADAGQANAARSGLRRILGFTSRLRAKGIEHAIEQYTSGVLEVSFTIGGRRFEVEFSADDVLYSVFDVHVRSLLDEAAIRQDVEVHARPYQQSIQVRRARVQAAE